MVQLRPDIEPLPHYMLNLMVDRGYPVPWFVAWPEGPTGPPEFRLLDPAKYQQAVINKLCWVCGNKLGKYLVFLVGPMCCINRVSAEPPSHQACALYSVKNCPFLSKPNMVRREDGLPPENPDQIPGVMIKRNPGVIALWTTRSYNIFNDGKDKPLIQMGEPTSVEFWREGRRATVGEVTDAVEAGLPFLRAEAEHEEGAMAELDKMHAHFINKYVRGTISSAR